MNQEQIYTLSISKGPLKGVSFDISPGVIYLVGKNGAGKTQVLEAIKLGMCSIMAKEGNRHLNNYRAKVWGEKLYDEKNGRKRDYADLKDVFDELGQVPIEDTTETKRTKESRNEAGQKQQTFVETVTQTLNGEIFESKMMSSGTKAIVEKFAWDSRLGIPYPESRQHNSHNHPSAHLILWDEPEQYLHPSEQKKIPSRLDKWSKIHTRTLKINNFNTPPIFIFATTHSPFVLSGIGSRDNHNVVCLDQCRVKNESVEKSLSEIRMTANELLGAGIQDILPGKMILTEGSVETLFRGIAENLKLELGEFIVTANGDDNLKQRINNVSEIIKLIVQIGSSWPERNIFRISIHAVLDDKLIKEEIDGFETTQWVDIDSFALGSEQLEDIYPLDWINEFLLNQKGITDQWDGEELINTFLFKSCKILDKDKGAFKVELAKYVASKINRVEQLDEYLPKVSAFFKHWKATNSSTHD